MMHVAPKTVNETGCQYMQIQRGDGGFASEAVYRIPANSTQNFVYRVQVPDVNLEDVSDPKLSCEYVARGHGGYEDPFTLRAEIEESGLDQRLIGIGVGAAVILGLLSAGVIFLRRRNR